MNSNPVPDKAPAPPSQRPVWGWALYDWANSAFATTVMAGFFPIFFKQYWSSGVDVNLSTARLGLGNACASLVVALLAPLLGIIADRSASRKRLLLCFAYAGIGFTALLFFISQGRWELALLAYALAIIGWAGANVFYDALLPQLVPPSQLDRTSSLGYALGYLGGGLLFLGNVAMTLRPHWFGLADAGEAVRVAFLSVALWWGGFALFTWRWVPGEVRRRPGRDRTILKSGFVQLGRTLSQIRRLPSVWLFLLAYWFYIDGVDTIIRMAVDYGLSIGFSANDLILALLITQFVGFPSALAFGWLGQRWGVRRSIYLALGVYCGVTVWGAVMQRPAEFFGLAVVIGLVQGGIQALSRSYFARLIPVERSAEFFGFYNMLGKFAAIVGPALMGASGLLVRRWLASGVTDAERLSAIGHQAARISILSVLVLFIIGGVLFYFVDEKRAQAELDALSGDPS
ncbi:MAG: MFS transporter [Desulfosarcinaceae bacterium]|nr:MFS transporter [Desulfosarcinaceae bacterium]